MSTTKSKPRKLIRSGIERNKVLLRTNLILLFTLSMMIFIKPIMPSQAKLLTAVLLCMLVISGLFAADFSRTAFRILFSIGTLVVLVTLLNLVLPDSQNLNILTFFLNTLFFIIVTIALISHVASATEVYGSTLLCAINSYLLIGLTLSLLFFILNLFLPGSFLQLDPGDEGLSSYIYFGFVTLTTLGYGDITPDTALARSLSTFTALFGQLYLVIIMALIIGKYLTGKKTVE
jgi:voltage-gated potassium channel